MDFDTVEKVVFVGVELKIRNRFWGRLLRPTKVYLSTYMLLEWNVVRYQRFGEYHTVLKVNIAIGHPVSEEELFALDVLAALEKTGLLVAGEVFHRKRQAHIPLGIGRFWNGFSSEMTVSFVIKQIFYHRIASLSREKLKHHRTKGWSAALPSSWRRCSLHS